MRGSQGASNYRSQNDLDGVANRTRVQGARFTRYELAGRSPAASLAGWARRLLGAGDEETDWIEYEDQGGGVYRAAHLVDGRMETCVFILRRQDHPARAWLAGLFEREVLDAAERGALLAGQPKSGGADPGPTVCSCFGGGRNTICAAVCARGLKDAASVTTCVKAGANCGSCAPEIRRLVAELMGRGRGLMQAPDPSIRALPGRRRAASVH